MIYIIQPGDSLYLLALKFHAAVEDIMAANGLADPNLIYPGQVLFLPVASAMHSDGREYIVKPGDSLELVAQKHNVELRDIIKSNNIKAPYIIYPGQTIVVPDKRLPHPLNEKTTPSET